MPFVKVTDSLYVNTDNILTACDKTGIISFIHRPGEATLTIDPQAVSYLLTQVEACAALIRNPLPAASLASRIANALRFDFPEGAALNDLVTSLFAADANIGIHTGTLVIEALTELLAERVVKLSPGGLYYHAANYITPSLDPSTEAEAPPIPLAEDT